MAELSSFWNITLDNREKWMLVDKVIENIYAREFGLCVAYAISPDMFYSYILIYNLF